MAFWTPLTVAYHLASRLAYVLWVGTALTRQDRHQSFTGPHGVEAGFQLFRRRAARLMANDAASFVVLCVVTRDSMSVDLPRGLVLALSALLVVVGIGTKVWAANTLGRKAYYWYNFFAPVPPVRLDPPGPYRYLRNPMYTVGYLQAYGLALALGSLPGLVMALVDQAAILAFHHRVEKPHYLALCATAVSTAPASPSRAP
jgi:protein-S-isoprenylcysteine O-methyltransferase Ste14